MTKFTTVAESLDMMKNLLEQCKFMYQLSDAEFSKLVTSVKLKSQLVMFVELNPNARLDDVEQIGDVNRLKPESIEVVSISAGEMRIIVNLLSGQYVHARLKFDLPITLRNDTEAKLSTAWRRIVEFNAVADVSIDKFLDLETGLYLDEMFNVYAVMKFEDKLKLGSGQND